jgi:hypothetical protein
MKRESVIESEESVIELELFVAPPYLVPNNPYQTTTEKRFCQETLTKTVLLHHSFSQKNLTKPVHSIATFGN